MNLMPMYTFMRHQGVNYIISYPKGVPRSCATLLASLPHSKCGHRCHLQQELLNAAIPSTFLAAAECERSDDSTFDTLKIRRVTREL